MSNLKDLKKLKSVEIDEFNGVKTKIASVELTEVEEKDFGDGKQLTRQILIMSENLTDDEKNPMTAREYIPLKFDKDEKVWGYSESPKAKAMQVLNFYKVDSFDKLIGKEVIVLKKQRESGKEYLGIQF